MSDNIAGEPMTAADVRRSQLVATKQPTGHMAIIPQDFEQVWRLAQVFAGAGDMVPKHYRGNPNATCAAIMWGMELGMSPIQALNGIAIINGRAAIWGDAMLAVVVTHPAFVDCLEEPIMDTAADGSGRQVIFGYKVTAKRKGREPVIRQFTIADAAKARLTLKSDTPWQTYPERMCQMRARSWALRDTFADALRGIASADEMRDAALEGEFTVVPQRDAAPPPAAAAEPAQSVPMPQPRADAQLPPPELDPLAELTAIAARQAAQRAPVAAEAQPPVQQAAEGKPATPQADLLAGVSSSRELRKPLTKGQRASLDAYLNTAEPLGLTEQDVFDHLADTVHQANFQQAIEFLQGKLRAAQDAP